ncbi:MAG: sporulation initiation factor Spo0A C-terminal domain-containing protein [Bacillota bacterium]|nr:sporulation initiation factor Spo0A C-terminal domain-containing protein [Bacillota bacterium]
MDNKAFEVLFEELRLLRVEVAQFNAKLEGIIGSKPTYVTPDTLETKISALLHELKISANLKGYQYLREALQMVINDFELTGLITVELYPTIAKKYVTTPSRVERAIRHAIEVSYKRNREHPYYKEYPHIKPTNGQFVADMADKFRLEDVQLQAVGQD